MRLHRTTARSSTPLQIPKLISDADLAAGLVYPRVKAIREISAAVAVAVIEAAHAAGHVGGDGAREALALGGGARLLRWVKKHMYSPFEYASLAYRPPGIGE